MVLRYPWSLLQLLINKGTFLIDADMVSEDKKTEAGLSIKILRNVKGCLHGGSNDLASAEARSPIPSLKNL